MAINIKKDNLRAVINPENGQLISLTLDGLEFFHDGGSPTWNGRGWGSSEIIAYPVFGPVDNYSVTVKDQQFTLDQHGISRHTTILPFIPKKADKDLVSLVQTYDGTSIPNSKFKPGKDRPKELSWLPYELKKEFQLKRNLLVCRLTVTNVSQTEMPYLIGWHPAFKFLGDVDNGVFLNDNGEQLATLEQVMIASEIPPGEALTLEGIRSVTYMNSGLGVRVSSEDFDNSMMLWSPSRDAGMLCIEHTSQLPVFEKQKYFGDTVRCERLAPGDKKTYTITVQPIIDLSL